MLNILAYGYGDRAISWLTETSFVSWLEADDKRIVKVTDKAPQKRGSIALVGDREIEVGLWNNNNYYFDILLLCPFDPDNEIRESLVADGVDERKIIGLDNLIKDYEEWLYSEELFLGNGVEIGGPSKIFRRAYIKCKSCDCVNYSIKTVWSEYDSTRYICDNLDLGSIIVAEATNMNVITDEKYDFCLSSNNLEHIANPLKALMEFTRIIKKGGKVIVAVPRKSRLFDHNREYTEFEHILNDFDNDVKEDDMTHLPEIVEKHDYDLDVECGGKEAFILRAQKNYENRCLHHHVFSLDVLRRLFDYVGLKIMREGIDDVNYIMIGERVR